MMTMNQSCIDIEIRGFKDFQRFHKFDLLRSRDVISHVTIGLGIHGFLLVVHWNHACILHRYGDMGPQIYWGHDLHFWGHATSSLTWPSDLAWALSYGGQWWPCTYLAWVRRYGASKILGSRVWPFGVTWRHRSRDHSTRHMWFPIGGPLEPASILHSYGDIKPQICICPC